MVILFIVVGSIFGAGAATFALWSGGTILFALSCYVLFGTLSAMVVVYAMYLYFIAQGDTSNWTEASKPRSPVSA